MLPIDEQQLKEANAVNAGLKDYEDGKTSDGLLAVDKITEKYHS